MTVFDERTPDLETNTQYKVMLSGYKWALSMIGEARTKSILDCACGQGYGSDLLSASAAGVVGVDISSEAVEHCRARYARPNLRFEVMDACALDFPENSFDAVVSQDTIEHVRDDAGFMREMRRVLKNDGVLVIFTPNSPEHNEAPAHSYHVREYSAESFRALAGRYFSKVDYYGRRLSPALAELERGLDRIRRADPLGVRRLLPVKLRHMAASLLAGLRGQKKLEDVSADDIEYFSGLGESPTIIAVCRK